MSMKIPIELAILGCCATLAAAQDLNIKPGLWEFTVTQEMNGDQMSVLPAKEKAQFEEAKARMSPEQRAQMEAQQAAITAMMAKPIVKQSCVTKENIRTSLAQFAADASAGKDESGCKVTLLRSTATVMESRGVCSRNGFNSIYTLLFEAPNPQTLTFKEEGSVVSGGTLELKSKASGKWLGPACGSVKP
jgi:hypothetical protein